MIFFIASIIVFTIAWQVIRYMDKRGALPKYSSANFLEIPAKTGDRPRHPLNIAGDFYTEADVCMLCGSPEAEAMGLMTHSNEGCYFIKQPETDAEIECAINAVAVSCISAVRYGGTNQKIIERLHELKCEDSCDYPLNHVDQ
jgi:hypothetical protein